MTYHFYRFIQDDGSGNPILYDRSGQQLLKIQHDGSTAVNIYGDATTSHDLKLRGNTLNAYTYVDIQGNAHFIEYVKGGQYEILSNDGTFFLCRYLSGSDATIDSYQSNHNIYLKPHGTGKVKFGTHAAITTETLTGYIDILDGAGNARKLGVVS